MTNLHQGEQTYTGNTGLYDKATLAMSASFFGGLATWQMLAGKGYVPSLGNMQGTLLERAIQDTGQHPGPSIAIGFATGWVYHQCDRLCAEPGSDRASRGPGVAAGVVAVSTAAAVNMGNEAYEWVTATDVTGNPTKPEISQPDIAVGTGSVALTLVIAAAVAKYRSLGRTA